MLHLLKLLLFLMSWKSVNKVRQEGNASFPKCGNDFKILFPSKLHIKRLSLYRIYIFNNHSTYKTWIDYGKQFSGASVTNVVWEGGKVFLWVKIINLLQEELWMQYRHYLQLLSFYSQQTKLIVLSVLVVLKSTYHLYIL